MKRLLYKLLVGLIAFGVGVASSAVWNAHRAISVCELAANPTYYAGKKIRVRAVLLDSGDYVFVFSGCGSKTVASVELEADVRRRGNYTLPESHLTMSGEGDQIYLADAVIVGLLEPECSSGYFAPQCRLSSARVESIISIRKFRDSLQAREWVQSR